MRIAIFGGSFNPLHTGHLFIAEETRIELCYDKVIFVPANIPSHKNDFSGIDAYSRFVMVQEALKEYDYFSVDGCDIERGGISYTIDTINYIYNNYDFTGKLGFIIGDDLLPDFSKWKDADKLKQLIDLIVVKRENTNKIESVYPDYYINNTILSISSTEIRKRVKAGKTIKYLVPEQVRLIILKNNYYR
jgi:nicotinate-nucleotide adenylyltransferase